MPVDAQPRSKWDQLKCKYDEQFISVDIECDGPIPGEYSMLSLGAVTIEMPIQQFYVELQPISEKFVPEALAVSGLDRQKLIEEATDPHDAMKNFAQWVESRGTRPVFVSFSTWDWMFVYYYLMRFVGRSPFGHSSLDMKSFYAGRYDMSWRGTSKKSIRRYNPQLLRGAGKHTHNALDDAEEQAEIFRRMLRHDKATTNYV